MDVHATLQRGTQATLGAVAVGSAGVPDAPASTLTLHSDAGAGGDSACLAGASGAASGPGLAPAGAASLAQPPSAAVASVQEAEAVAAAPAQVADASSTPALSTIGVAAARGREPAPATHKRPRPSRILPTPEDAAGFGFSPWPKADASAAGKPPSVDLVKLGAQAGADGLLPVSPLFRRVAGIMIADPHGHRALPPSGTVAPTFTVTDIAALTTQLLEGAAAMEAPGLEHTGTPPQRQPGRKLRVVVGGCRNSDSAAGRAVEHRLAARLRLAHVTPLDILLASAAVLRAGVDTLQATGAAVPVEVQAACDLLCREPFASAAEAQARLGGV